MKSGLLKTGWTVALTAVLTAMVAGSGPVGTDSPVMGYPAVTSAHTPPQSSPKEGGDPKFSLLPALGEGRDGVSSLVNPKSPTTDRPVSLTLAPAAADFDVGLDVRDAQGRPVKSPEKTRQLRQLFVSSLYGLLTRPDLPRVAEALAVLERTWFRFAGVLRRAASERWRAFVDLWCPPNRRFAPPFTLLLGFVVLLATCHLTLFTAASPRLLSHLTKLSSTLLRC